LLPTLLRLQRFLFFLRAGSFSVSHLFLRLQGLLFSFEAGRVIAGCLFLRFLLFLMLLWRVLSVEYVSDRHSSVRRTLGLI
ncbi:putative transmembrane protein, partial [Gregarina niphandrodes]